MSRLLEDIERALGALLELGLAGATAGLLPALLRGVGRAGEKPLEAMATVFANGDVTGVLPCHVESFITTCGFDDVVRYARGMPPVVGASIGGVLDNVGEKCCDPVYTVLTYAFVKSTVTCRVNSDGTLSCGTSSGKMNYIIPFGAAYVRTSDKCMTFRDIGNAEQNSKDCSGLACGEKCECDGCIYIVYDECCAAAWPGYKDFKNPVGFMYDVYGGSSGFCVEGGNGKRVCVNRRVLCEGGKFWYVPLLRIVTGTVCGWVGFVFVIDVAAEPFMPALLLPSG